MTTIIENLLALRAQMDATIAAVQADGSGSKLMPAIAKGGKAKVPKAEKPLRANAGMPTLHGAWTKHVLAVHSTKTPEYQEWLAARIASAKAGELLYNEGHAKVKKGKKQVGEPMDEKEAAVAAHTPWVGHWRKEHPEEFQTFKNDWEAANPKESRVASAKASQASQASSDAEGEAAVNVPKKRGIKKMADMTPEEQAIAKAKRAANKAAKAAAKASSEEEEAEEFAMETVVSTKTPSAAIGGGGSAAAPAAEEMLEAEEEAEEAEDALIPFTHKKINYLRYGHLDEDGEGVWWEGGDLWLKNADGSKGAYAGQIKASGKIDASAEVMAAEPDIN
jgi:hypothetical protein